jgi:hypothetical protein
MAFSLVIVARLALLIIGLPLKVRIRRICPVHHRDSPAAEKETHTFSQTFTTVTWPMFDTHTHAVPSCAR